MWTRKAHILEDKWRSDDVKLREDADFSSLLLSKKVLTGLQNAGFKHPSPIQLEAIPVGRFGKDLIVQAKSGTGKTLVFSLIALEVIVEQLKHPQVLILAPTREIAFQICDVIRAVGSGFNDLKCCTFIGGLPISDDMEAVIGCQIVVGTPGRIKQLMDSKILLGGYIRLVVLDEADQLLDKSFKSDIETIIKFTRKERQVIATSATYPKKLQSLVDLFFRDPYLARLNQDQLSLLGMIHYSCSVDSSQMAVLAYRMRLQILEAILTTVEFSQCLVFCNLISRVETLCTDIRKWGFSAAYISSAKEQGARLKAIECLKRFKCKVLVSSDLSSRGIDAENVDLIINFDSPLMTEVYLHRVGRAGRYGSKGVAITFLTNKDVDVFKKIETEGNFKAYELPDPVPKNLINIRPERILSSEDGACSVGSDESISALDVDISISIQDNLKNDDSQFNKNGKPLVEGAEGEGYPPEAVSNVGSETEDIADCEEKMPNCPTESHSQSEILVTASQNSSDASKIDAALELIEHLKENGEPTQNAAQIMENQFLTKCLTEGDCESNEWASQKQGKCKHDQTLKTTKESKPKSIAIPKPSAIRKVCDFVDQKKTQMSLLECPQSTSIDSELTLPVVNILNLCEDNKRVSVAEEKKLFKKDLLAQISKTSGARNSLLEYYTGACKKYAQWYLENNNIDQSVKDFQLGLVKELLSEKVHSSDSAASPDGPTCLNQSENDSAINSEKLHLETKQECLESKNVQQDLLEKELDEFIDFCMSTCGPESTPLKECDKMRVADSNSTSSESESVRLNRFLVLEKKFGEVFNKPKRSPAFSTVDKPKESHHTVEVPKSVFFSDQALHNESHKNSRGAVHTTSSDESTDEFEGAWAAKASKPYDHKTLRDTSSSTEIASDSHKQVDQVPKKHWLLTSPRTRQKTHHVEQSIFYPKKKNAQAYRTSSGCDDDHENPPPLPKNHWLLTSPRTRHKSHQVEKKISQPASKKLPKGDMEAHSSPIYSHYPTCAQASGSSSGSDESTNDSDKKPHRIPKKHWLLTSPRTRQRSYQVEEQSVFYPEKNLQSGSKKFSKDETKVHNTPIYSHKSTCPLAPLQASQSRSHNRPNYYHQSYPHGDRSNRPNYYHQSYPHGGRSNRPNYYHQSYPHGDRSNRPNYYHQSYPHVDQSRHSCSNSSCMPPSTHSCHSPHSRCNSEFCVDWLEIFHQQCAFIYQLSPYQ